MTKLYVAEFACGKANFATVESIKETPKNHIIDWTATKQLWGWQYIPSRLHKDKYHCFLAAEDALDYLLSKMNQNISNLEAELIQAKDAREDLAQAREDLKGE